MPTISNLFVCTCSMHGIWPNNNQGEWTDGTRRLKYSVTEGREYLSANELEERSGDDAQKLLINPSKK